MGLTKNQLLLIRAVAEENLEKAKLYAIACCAEDTTQKNKQEVTRYQRTLKSHALELMELPANISMFATLENLAENYNEKRYFLSESEKQLLEQISSMYAASLKLMEKQIHYLNATLLYGESGVGKTAFAKYVAYNRQLSWWDSEEPHSPVSVYTKAKVRCNAGRNRCPCSKKEICRQWCSSRSIQKYNLFIADAGPNLQ